jgi:hypothetical protein
MIAGGERRLATRTTFAEPCQDRHVDDPEPRHRGRRRRHLHLLPAGIAGRLPRRHSRRPARLPHAALQFRGDHAAARRTSAPPEGEGGVGLIWLVIPGRASWRESGISRFSDAQLRILVRRSAPPRNDGGKSYSSVGRISGSVIRRYVRRDGGLRRSLSSGRASRGPAGLTRPVIRDCMLVMRKLPVVPICRNRRH